MRYPPFRDDLLGIILFRLLEDRDDWSVISDRLAGAYQALVEAERAASDDLIVAKGDFAVLVRATIDVLGTPPITCREQAFYWSLSADPTHRQVSQAWFERNPVERDILAAMIEALDTPGRH